MNFSFTKEQTALRNAVITFARRELSNRTTPRGEDNAFFREYWKKCADFGIQGMPFAAAYGGQGKDTVSTILALDTLGYACKDNSLCFRLGVQVWGVQTPINEFGTHEQKSRFLAPTCSGAWIGARASTPATLHMLRDGNDYIVSGRQLFAPHASFADVLLVFAASDQGETAFLVERKTPGLRVDNGVDDAGEHSVWFAFEACRIPGANRLGRDGQGGELFRRSMEWERGCILAPCVGAMQRQLEASVEHARTHERFGQPIGKSQTVANHLVDLRTRWETSRWLLYQMAWMKGRDGKAAMESAVAALHISESWVKSCLDAIQVFGEYGGTTEYELERDLRDAVGGTLYSGTTEIQRNLIASHLGL